MKEVKKAISAALAATLTTGVASTVVAGATTVDELYKAAYEATMTALNKKDQESINAARVAIDKLPKELQAFKGEFSKQVDTVQHPILVTIVDAINNADKTLKQADINTARKAIPATLPEVWRNSYSTGVDAAQQKLIAKTVEASEKAIKSGAKADMDAAIALIKEVATVENNDGVKAWADTFAKDFAAKVKLTVVSVNVVSNNTIKVNFSKEVDATTVTNRAFVATQKESGNDLWVSSVKVSEDKKSVEVKFADTLVEDKVNTLDVKNIKDLAGNVIDVPAVEFTYAKADIASVELTKTKVTKDTDLTKFVVIKDSLGRDITANTTVEFETSNDAVVTEAGLAAGLGQSIVNVVVKSGTDVIFRGADVIVTVADSKNTEYQGFTLHTEAIAADKNAYSKVEKVSDVKLEAPVSSLALFFKDQYGTEQEAVIADSVKNLTPDVAILNANGTITAISEGTASFKVTVGTIEKIVTINVKAAAKPVALNADKTNVTLAAKSAITQEINLDVKDQYGLAFADQTATLKVEVKGKDGKFTEVEGVYSAATVDGTVDATKATAKVTVTAKDTAGTDTYKVTYTFVKNGVTTKFEKVFTATVKAQGELAGFEVGTVANLDLFNYEDADKKDETTGSFVVYKLDTNGSRVAVVEDAITKIFDKDGNDVTAKFTVANAAENTIATKAGVEVGTYKVTVTVGSYVAKTYTLTVKDSEVKATTVVFNELSLNGTTDETAQNVTKLVTVVDQFGKTIALGQNEDGFVATSNATAKKTNVVMVDSKEVSYDLVMTEVVVTAKDKAAVTVKLAKPVVVRVIIK